MKETKKFRPLVDEALAFVKEVDVEKANEEDLDKYLQKTALRADDYSSFVILEGTTTNNSRVHFGNTTQRNFSIIKKAWIGGQTVPLLSDNGLRGVVNHELRVMSRKMGIGEPRCGIFDPKGLQRHECGSCLRCGIMGFLSIGRKKPGIRGTSLNMPHRLAIRSFLPESAEIIQEYHNSLDDATGSVFAPPGKKAKEKATSLYSMEYVAPGGRFPLSIVMRGMAIGEIGLALMAIGQAWYRLGVGRHKGGSMTTWDQRPEDWTLRYEPITSFREEYGKGELPTLINDVKKVAYIAIEKKLFRPFTLAEVKREG